MRKIRKEYIYSVAVAVVATILTYVFQRFRMLELEECYIFLYDTDWIVDTVDHPGGLAQALASFATQFMVTPIVGPLIAGVIYGAITFLLCRIAGAFSASTPTYALSIATSICLFLCLENNSYKFQGHIAILLSVLWACDYVTVCRAIDSRGGIPAKAAVGINLGRAILLSVIAYITAGSAAWVTVAAIVIYDLSQTPRRWFGLICIAITAACGYWAYRMQTVPTLKRALTPGMYYEWDTTAYMMLYTWCSAVVFMLVAALWTRNSRHNAIITAILITVQLAAGARMYTLVHAPTVYRTMQQRYLAKNGDWDAILSIDYGNEPTPYTSYRFLALAQKGMLVDKLNDTRPYIDYFMKNTSLVKKEDLEALSDIYYACDYMAAARHFAFDTNIVTPGAFNPTEMLKLAEINILTGDYNIAEKYVSQLEKTLNYSDRATALRRYLNNPEAVQSDPILSRKLSAIPQESNYMSPKGTLRDLRHITSANPDQKVAQQFLDAFIILTHYHD